MLGQIAEVAAAVDAHKRSADPCAVALHVPKARLFWSTALCSSAWPPMPLWPLQALTAMGTCDRPTLMPALQKELHER
jgi:hypothetical protein